MMDSQNIENIDVLNLDKEESTISPIQLLNTKINIKSYVVSDADEELLILISFKKIIDLKSIKIHALSEKKEDDDDDQDISAPKQVYIYHTKNININFDDIKSMKHDKSILCKIKKLEKGQNINLQKVSKNAIKFKKTKYLAIYIESNQKETENTFLNAISFKGTVTEDMNSADNIQPSMQQKYNKDIVEQLIRFGYEIQDIQNAMHVVTDKNDINQIMEQIDNEQKITEEMHDKDMIFGKTDKQNRQRFKEIFTCYDSQKFSDPINSEHLLKVYKRKVVESNKNNGNKEEEDLQRAIAASLGHEYVSIHQQHSIDKCLSIQRLGIALNEYNRFFQQKNEDEQKSNDDINKWLDDVLNDDYDASALLNDFHHLLDIHDHEFDEIYGILSKQYNNNNKSCELSTCFLMRRTHRDRALIDLNNKILNQLYLNPNDVNDITKQQILDKIHCHYFHSFDTGYILSNNDKLSIHDIVDNDDKKDDQDIDNYADDALVTAICKHISQKKQAFIDCDELKTLKENNPKFLTHLDDEIRYSFGYRFFYWDSYKNDQRSLDIVRSMNDVLPEPANQGYKVCDWYIPTKYSNLKDELLNNPIHTISKYQWKILMQKAYVHLSSERFRAVTVARFEMDLIVDLGVNKSTEINLGAPYGLQYRSCIDVLHLIAMLVYCNEDALSRDFSATYRRIPSTESDDALIKRHSNFAHLGRLLRECVEAYDFGVGASGFKNVHLYHGMTIKTQFNTMNACIKGPVSTSTAYAVAVNFCGNEGIILDLLLDAFWELKSGTDLALFECKYLSDYPNEQEVFFIGGFSKFLFESVILAPNGQNYSEYTTALAAIYEFCYASQNELKLSDKQKQICFRMISHELHRFFPDDDQYFEFKTMPLYVRGLLKRQFENINNLRIFYNSDSQVNVNQFLLKLFKHLFFYDNGWMKVDVLTKVFPSLKQVLLEMEKDNENFIKYNCIYSSVLSLIQNNPHGNIQRFAIQIPRNENVINKAKRIIAPYQSKFSALGWTIRVKRHGVEGGKYDNYGIKSLQNRWYVDMLSNEHWMWLQNVNW